jgi:retinol dehydrogenase 12
MTSKNIIITGATSGIGRATAKLLAEKGNKIIVLGRDENKAQETVGFLNKINGLNNEYVLCDFADLESVKKAAEKIISLNFNIDVLVNNAGCFFENFIPSKQGIEMQWSVNHLSHFLLTNLLKEQLIKSKTRIVNVSSGIHYMGKIDENSFFEKNNYSGIKAYGQSKLANVLFTLKLAKLTKDTGITVNALHPGGINTDIGTKNTQGFINKLWSWASIFMKSEEEGAKTSVYLAISPDVENVSGRYFTKCKQKTPSKLARDISLADNVWEISKNQCALTDDLCF